MLTGETGTLATEVRSYAFNVACQASGYTTRFSRGTMSAPDGFPLRVGFGFWRLNQRAYPNEVTQTVLAERVAARAGRSYSQTAASGWLSGRVPREIGAMDALAVELDLDHNWLYFKRGPAPQGFANWVKSVGGKSPYISSATAPRPATGVAQRVEERRRKSTNNQTRGL